MLKHESHETFEELCALAATGQLSNEEQKQLAEHLENCESCRAAREDFSLVFEELPPPEPRSSGRAVIRRLEKNGLRERFLDRARAQGRRFSAAAEEPSSANRWQVPAFLSAKTWPAYPLVAAGLVLAVLAGAVGYRSLSRVVATPSASNSQIKAEARVVPESVQSGTDTSIVQAKLSQLQSLQTASEQVISGLKTENAALITRVENLEKQFAAAQSDKQEMQQLLSSANEKSAQLSAQNDETTQLLARTRTELEQSRGERSNALASLATRDRAIDDLSQQIRLQNVSGDREKELLAAGRDITDLMGARNLHIIDVHDSDGRGKDRRSFGRVFYTEGKSLIFYAFDLDEKRLANAKFTFEAWGERLGQPTSIKSLGMLFVDDKQQKRWVLKVDDPQQLAEIDSVFVTLEPHGSNGEKPRGQRVLYAFLGGKPNHP